MATFYDFWEIKVEGTSRAVNSICEAITNLEPECMIEKKRNIIRVWDTCKVSGEEGIADFAVMVARAADGANFTMDGYIECSGFATKMLFAVEFIEGELAMRYTDWIEVYNPSCLEDYETYEEYCEECEEISEMEFQMIKENDETYCVGDKIYVTIPFVVSIKMEY